MAEVKQYINLEADPAKTDLGREVRVKTKISVKEPGEVHLWLKPGGGNLDPSKLGAADRGGVLAADAMHQTVMTEADGTFKFALLMSVHGGDKFSVEVSREKDGEKKANGDEYVVWRKLYFQLSKMKATYALAEGTVAGEYRDHFIELEKTSAVSVPHKENLETDELPTYRTHFKGVKRPFEAHVALIDRQCDSRNLRVTSTMNERVKIRSLPAGTRAWPFVDWLVYAKWRATGQPWQAGAAVTQVDSAGGPALRVDLSGIPADPTKTPIEVEVCVKTLVGEYTGDATYKPHVFIAVGKPRSADSIGKTVAHEIGHGIGMVPTSGHDLQYDNRNGGQGSHCRHGASPNVPSKAKGGAFAGEYSGGTCVMYAFSSEHYKFCATCKEFVRKALLFKSDMQTRGW